MNLFPNLQLNNFLRAAPKKRRGGEARNGALEYWSIGFVHYSITPPLHYSSLSSGDERNEVYELFQQSAVS
jgi:hypothetical protein